MFVCNDCKGEFETAETFKEMHGFNSPPYETVSCCPYCKSTDIRQKNTEHCRCCGAHLKEGVQEYCSERCRIRGEELWRKERQRRDEQYQNPLSKIIRELEHYNAEHGTKLSYGEYVALIRPKRSKRYV